MLKVFTYDTDKIWPPGKSRPPGTHHLDDKVERVSDPQAAHVIMVPWPIYDYEYHKVNPRAHLAHLKGMEEKHCWLEIADCYNDHKKLVGNGIFFTCNLNRERQALHPTAIPIAWPVEDLGAWMDPGPEGLKYDVCFQGWDSCPERAASVESVRASGLRAHLETYKEFFGYYENEARGKERRKSYLERLRESLVLLSPRSIPGVFPYRFWEAMSAGRIPALVCDDYVLPMADRIPYEKFCIFIRDADASRAGTIIKTWIESKKSDEITALCRLARESWATHLDTRKWPTLMREMLERKFGL